MNIIGGIIQQPLLDMLAVGLSPEVYEVPDVILPQFERQRSAFRTGACSEAWEDVAVHIDNAIWCRLGILHGPPAATGKLDFLVCTHEQDFRWKCRSVPHVPVR